MIIRILEAQLWVQLAFIVVLLGTMMMLCISMPKDKTN